MTAKLLLIIFILALFLRLYRLADLPYGFHVDEAKAAWNAYSILTTGYDDQGHLLPLTYNSFGDYRPAAIFYTIIPFIIFLGKTVLAVRFSSALFGALTVFPLYSLVKFTQAKNTSTYLPCLAALLLAVNPWHINVSRATSEVVISLFFSTLALFYTFKYLALSKFKFGCFSLVFFGFSFLFYHSIRVMAPIFILIIYLFYRRSKHLLVLLILAFLLTVMYFIPHSSWGRLSQISIKNDIRVDYEIQKMPNEEGPGKVFVARFFHNKVAAYAKSFFIEFQQYFSTEFFLGDSARPIRYRTPYFALLTYPEFILIIFALISLTIYPKTSIFWVLFLVSPLPSALTLEDTPNLHRALLMLPFLVIIESYGLSFLLSRKIHFYFFFLFFFIFVLNFIYYLHLYYVHSKFSLSTYYRNGGAIELSQLINRLVNDYDFVIFTNHPDNPYPWLMFFGSVYPSNFLSSYHQLTDGSFQYQKFIFTQQRCPSQTVFSQYRQFKLLVVDGEGCELNPKLIKEVPVSFLTTVRRLDNSPPYLLWQN